VRLRKVDVDDDVSSAFSFSLDALDATSEDFGDIPCVAKLSIFRFRLPFSCGVLPSAFCAWTRREATRRDEKSFRIRSSSDRDLNSYVCGLFVFPLEDVLCSITFSKFRGWLAGLTWCLAMDSQMYWRGVGVAVSVLVFAG